MRLLNGNLLKRIQKSLKARFGIEINLLQKSNGFASKPRYEYQKAFINFDIKPGEKVLDIGSGHNPFPLATHLADFSEDTSSHRIHELVKDERPMSICNIESMPFGNKEFDFVYCSHVLEHTANPARACEELMRIGKRGYIETPTRLTDTIFNFTKIKGHHRWFVETLGNSLIFLEYDEKKLRDTGSDYFYKEYTSKWDNPVQQLIQNNLELFVNMFLWQGRFDYFVFDKGGNLITDNKSKGKNDVA